MSRIKKTIKNAKVGVFFYSITLFVHFFSRKIFLDGLGDEFIGLTSTLQSILGFLNLAELGVGTAIGVTLYGPLFKNDKKEINKIIALIGYLYKKIGIGVFTLALIVSVFIPFIFSETTINLTIVYLAFFSFLTSSLLSYFINYHIVILQADQKTYVVSSIYQSFTIIKLIIQSILVYYYQAYYLWILLEFIFPIIYAIVLRSRMKKEYPWLILNNKEDSSITKGYPEVIKLIKQTFVHKIGGFVLGGTDHILIFALVNLKSVAFFGNYQLIFQKLTQLIDNFFGGIDAGVGNLVAENNYSNIRKVFWEMMALRFLIGGFICINLYYLIEPFILLWLGEKYILDQWILILMLLNLFISQIRTPVENFKNAYALLWDVWAPIAEIIINLSISLIFGMMWGIKGIMFGTLMSLLVIVLFWKPYFLYKHGFRKNVLEYWSGFAKLFLTLIISLIIIWWLVDLFCNLNVDTYTDWILLSLKISLITLGVYIPILILNRGFRNLMTRFNKLIRKKLPK
jgi:O-antigen/teichoic acid export membrane protein